MLVPLSMGEESLLHKQAVINNCKDILSSHNLFQEADCRIDIKTLDKLWSIDNGQIKVLSKDLSSFCTQLHEYLNNDENIYFQKSAKNVASAIMYACMAKDDRYAIRFFQRKPIYGIPNSLKGYNRSKLDHLIEFYNTPRMWSVMEAVLLTMEALQPKLENRNQREIGDASNLVGDKFETI
ncbi:hypothetical protein RF11_01344 [Thelohanellus kitauei]|uniref:Uncharacterized protein n=1 Tax=Thelohanellus kitauei TaxID=669202 RepID=A0A0C2MWT0_THEKT|nr:hypothetical protein RF11_01344 [Thelohanellus kitauei]